MLVVGTSFIHSDQTSMLSQINGAVRTVKVVEQHRCTEWAVGGISESDDGPGQVVGQHSPSQAKCALD